MKDWLAAFRNVPEEETAMKCFTLRPETHVFLGGSPHGMGSHAITDRYPTVRPGINLNDEHAVSLAWATNVPASEDLLKQSTDGRIVKREGRDVSVLRASVDKKNGGVVLVPERDEDKNAALILLAVQARPGIYLTHEADQELVLARGVDDGGRWGRDEELLITLKPWQSVRCIRRDRKWIFWGDIRHVETLTIRYDGKNVFFDVNPPRRSYVD